MLMIISLSYYILINIQKVRYKMGWEHCEIAV
jgi:hypothetical protein